MNKCFLILLVIAFASCGKNNTKKSIAAENWKARTATLHNQDSLEFGKSYLSVYSQIYSSTEHTTHNLTAMVSLRNVSDVDTIFVLNAKYFDTHGKLVKTYFDTPIFLSPLETAEIIIDEKDIAGGTGSNFLFEWKTPRNTPEPLFEAIMNSTMSQQGLSFITQGKRVE